MAAGTQVAIDHTVALLAISLSMQAFQTDDRIEATVKEAYVFKTYLKDDAVKIKSKDGAVTLTGTVAEESHKSLAGETVASLPEVKNVDNPLGVKGNAPPRNQMHGSVRK